MAKIKDIRFNMNSQKKSNLIIVPPKDQKSQNFIVQLLENMEKANLYSALATTLEPFCKKLDDDVRNLKNLYDPLLEKCSLGIYFSARYFF